MKGSLWLLMLGLSPAVPVMAAGAMPAVPATTASASAATVLNRHTLSYAIGYRIGSHFADGPAHVDLPVLIKALEDAYARRPPEVSMRVMQSQLQSLAQQMQHKALVGFRKLAAANARKSEAFMRANQHKPGIVSLPSGVQYKVIKQGHGISPTLASTVVINYRGALVNDMTFDDTWAHGKPVTYAVRHMLPGWREVLPRMHVGARWKVFIPPQQAYGERGQLPRIGPNEALVFDIQLLGVKH